MKNSVNATVGNEKITVTRSEVKKEGRVAKILALLANTVLKVTLTSREDFRTGQIDIDAAGNTPNNIVSPNPNRKSIILRNIGVQDVYIGDYNVTTSTGYLLQKTDSILIDRTWGAIYAVSTLGSKIAYLEQ